MFSKLRNLFLAAAIGLSGTAPAHALISGPAGQVVYRYTDGHGITNPVDPGVSKDITAFFVGGVGFDFSEALPLKPQWQDDDWELVTQTLPPGISWNAETKTFEGTPTAAVSGQIVDLQGVDMNGATATARVTFDIYTITGAPVKVDLYAHTGHYKFDQLPLPAGLDGTGLTFERVYATPPGIEIVGRNFDGIPTTAGPYPVMLIGKNYLGQPVVTYFGNYQVDDGPKFKQVGNTIVPVPTYLPADVEVYHPSIVRSIAGGKVRYLLVLEDGQTMPQGLSSMNAPYDTAITGYDRKPYNTAKAHWKAIDTDGTSGISSTFTFGTGQPTPICTAEGYPLLFFTGSKVNTHVLAPDGMIGTATYAVTSGTLPAGLVLTANGYIQGTPTDVTNGLAVFVGVTVTDTNGIHSVKTPCGFNVTIDPGSVSLADVTPPQAQHLRVGKTYSGTMTVNGGIAPYSTAFTPGQSYPAYAITNDTTNSKTVTVSGTVAAGTQFLDMTMTNGDKTKSTGNLTVYGYNPLAWPAVPGVTVTRLAADQSWATVAYDASTVIPDMSGNTSQPIMTALNAGTLPAGIYFDPSTYSFRGTTSAPEGQYGPVQITLADYSGDKTLVSNDVYVTVGKRTDIKLGTVTPPSFTVETDATPTLTPVTAIEPPGASAFKLTWTENGPLPAWVHFNVTDGSFTADANIPDAQKGQYGPVTVSVTDEEGSNATTDPFMITAADWPAPGNTGYSEPFRGTVTGDPAAGETTTSIDIENIKASIKPETVIGGLDGVVYDSASPATPAGIDFTPWQLVGVPTSAFDGSFAVNYKDARGRSGSITVPMQIKAYPAVKMSSDSIDLPRLSTVSGPAGQEVVPGDFWNPPVWSTVGNFPAGIKVDSGTGKLTGSTTEAADTTFAGLKLKAVSKGANGESLVSYTEPFTINVKTETPFKLDYSGTFTYYLNDKTETSPDYTLNSYDAATPLPTGSYLPALGYSINSRSPEGKTDGVDALGINAKTGILTGFPSELGRWTINVEAADSDTPQNSDTADIPVHATLYGFIKFDPKTGIGAGGGYGNGGNADGSGSASGFTLRVGEPFATTPVVASNKVGDVVFTTDPANIPSTMSFSALTGAFSSPSHIDSANTLFEVAINAKDDDGRTFENPFKLDFTTIDALKLALPTTSYQARQYDDATPIHAAFAPATNQMGKVRYTIAADPSNGLPGTLVTTAWTDTPKASTDVFTGYDWQAGSKSYHLDVDWTGSVTQYTVNGGVTYDHMISYAMPDGTVSVVTDPNPADYFPPDALVFDNHGLTLDGIPSKTGTFSMALAAVDDHETHYIADVDSRKPNNEASAGFTVTVLPAYDMTATASATSDTIQRLTSQSTLRIAVAHTAYGRGLVSAVSAGATPPQGVSPALVSGATGIYDNVGFLGYAEATGTYPGLVASVTDMAGRTLPTPAVSLVVTERGDLKITGTPNPQQLLVNETPASMVVSASNLPRGTAIKAADWTVSGTLPDNVTYKAQDGSVVFSGVPTKVGTWGGIVVGATDSEGMYRSTTVSFKVISPTDAIVLTVSDIKTKVGKSFSLQSTSDNTYGNVRYWSTGAVGNLPDGSTRAYGSNAAATAAPFFNVTDQGYLSGSFDTVENVVVNVSVGDETPRVTAEPVTVRVLPALQVVVPTNNDINQGVAAKVAVDTFNYVGTVTYQQGDGDWPAGIIVDPATGMLSGTTTAKTGVYSGLTINAVDTFPDGQTDAGTSNVFQITVKPTTDKPDIVAYSTKQLYTVGTAMSVLPNVNVKGKTPTAPWTYDGTTYSLDAALPAGLQLNTSTGEISGTATVPYLNTALKMTVTSSIGDTDSLTFWFGVQPADPITPKAGLKTGYKWRAGTAMASDAPTFDNTFGTVSYKLTSTALSPLAVSATTGVLSGTPTAALVKGKTDIPIEVTVTDVFGRTGAYDYTAQILNALTLATADVFADSSVPLVNEPSSSLTGLYGNATYEITGLPSDLTPNAQTGTISGQPTDDDLANTPTAFLVKVTDDYDNASTTVTSNLKSGHIFWRIWDNKTSGNWVWTNGSSTPSTTATENGTTRFMGWGAVLTTFYDAKGVSLNSYKVVNTDITATGWFKTDAIWAYSGNIDGYQMKRDAPLTGAWWKVWKFSKAVNVNSINWRWSDANNAQYSAIVYPHVQYSDDGVNWTESWTQTVAKSAATNRTITKPKP